MTRLVTLRKADMDDLDMLLRWRNDPDTVKWSLNSCIVGYEEHGRWLEKALNDPDRVVYIGVYNATPVGTIRFDSIKMSDGDRIFISITVAPEVRDRGYGKLILEAGCLLMRDHQLNAIIHAKNARSISLFSGLGFAEDGKASSKDFLIFTREPLLI